MKRGKGAEKVTGEPMFPRLHVSDTEKGGPRAPPRNKMALYEQLSVPSQRFNSGDLPLNNNNTANFVLPYSSQGNGHEREVFFSGQLPALRHPIEKPHGGSSGSNTPLCKVERRKQTEKDDFNVPIFVHFKDFASEEQIKSNNFINDTESDEDKTCKSSQTGKPDQSDDLSETSMVEYVSETDISPDDVVRIIGQKHFWKARRAIADQQRVLAVQVFELHRLLKVQKLIAASPNATLEDSTYLSKPLKSSSANRLPLECSVKAPENVSKPKNDSGKPNSRVECNAENSVKNDYRMGPWCFNQPSRHQWLIPVMSPSEGLVYKPHPGHSPVFGGCGPQGLTPLMGDFLPPTYGVPFASPTGHGYFPPFGMPVMNPVFPSPAIDQSNQVAATIFQGQLSGGGSNFSIQCQNSSNIASENNGAVQEVARFFPSRGPELQASTTSSPSERAHGVDVDNSDLIRQPPFPNHPARVIKVVPHNARSATESAARIFQSIQEERKQN